MTSLTLIDLEEFNSVTQQKKYWKISRKIQGKKVKYVWKQYEKNLPERKYQFYEYASVARLGFMLKNWGFTERKSNGTNYKECVMKTIWNTSAKLLQ